jgi:hypothetical protein
MKLIRKKRPRCYKCKFCRAQIKLVVLVDGVRACPTCNAIINQNKPVKYYQLDIFGNLNPINPKQ